jgi:hypothetical protein
MRLGLGLLRFSTDIGRRPARFRRFLLTYAEYARLVGISQCGRVWDVEMDGKGYILHRGRELARESVRKKVMPSSLI